MLCWDAGLRSRKTNKVSNQQMLAFYETQQIVLGHNQFDFQTTTPKQTVAFIISVWVCHISSISLLMPSVSFLKVDYLWHRTGQISWPDFHRSFCSWHALSHFWLTCPIHWRALLCAKWIAFRALTCGYT